MATVTQTLTTPSTLDILWAFYQSQPKRVRQAFRKRIEHMDEDLKLEEQWQQDLRYIKGLKENWDYEGAPCINRQAISQTSKLIRQTSKQVANSVRLYPTPLGGILLKLETKKGRIKCEIGDELMSYFVKRPGLPTEHHSYETTDKENLKTLKAHLENLL